MTALLRKLARSGFALSNPFHAKPHYIRPSRGDSRGDFGNIASDMKNVGKDFRRVAAKELADGRKTD